MQQEVKFSSRAEPLQLILRKCTSEAQTSSTTKTRKASEVFDIVQVTSPHPDIIMHQ